MDPIHPESMATNLRTLLQSSEYSDMIVRCGSEEFKLHRAIVCPRSMFFATAYNGQFKESMTGVITLEEDDPPTVRRMFTYIYNLDYNDAEGDAASVSPCILNPNDGSEINTVTRPDLSTNEAGIHKQLIIDVAVYAFAEKYDIPGLKRLAVSKSEEVLDRTEDLLYLLPVLVRAVFQTTPGADTDLRNVIIKYCQQHAGAIASDGNLSNMLLEHADLGLGIVREMINERVTWEDQAAIKIGSLDNKILELKLELRRLDRELGFLPETAARALASLDEVPCLGNAHLKSGRNAVLQLS